MKEYGLIVNISGVRTILEGRKTQTRCIVTPKTSEVGEGKVDWSKFCWDGSQVYLDTCHHGHTEKHKAPLPYINGRAIERFPYDQQYLHVPYLWVEQMTIYRIYPRWQVGDRLWVKETWFNWQGKPLYKATVDTNNEYPPRWQSPLFMPRWASRITLEITGVKVERLQEISREDARAEGMRHEGYWAGDTWHTSTGDFHFLWDSLNAKRGFPWASNCWVWVIEFRVLKR